MPTQAIKRIIAQNALLQTEAVINSLYTIYKAPTVQVHLKGINGHEKVTRLRCQIPGQTYC